MGPLRVRIAVPRPRLHLIRFHGVLAPNANLRTQVVPRESGAPAQEAKPAEREANCAHHRPVRLNWANLLKRVFEIDVEHRPNCGSELKIIAAILRGEPGLKRPSGPFVPGERQGLCALAAGDQEDPHLCDLMRRD